jgi:hypothetical protein
MERLRRPGSIQLSVTEVESENYICIELAQGHKETRAQLHGT